MDTERWLPVPVSPYVFLYNVSDLGRVFSIRSDRMLSLSQLRSGYSHVTLCCHGQRMTIDVHKLVMLAFVGPCPPDTEVCHENDIRTDNRLVNLRYGSRSANHYDSVRNGTHSETKKTECPQGHPYDEENTLFRKNGHRVCRTCNRERCSRRADIARRSLSLDLLKQAGQGAGIAPRASPGLLDQLLQSCVKYLMSAFTYLAGAPLRMSPVRPQASSPTYLQGTWSE